MIPLLKKAGRWADIGRSYRDPLRVLRGHHDTQRRASKVTSQHPEAVEAMQKYVLAETGTLHAVLRAAGRDADAQAVLGEARSLMPGDALEAAITAALSDAGLEAKPGPHGEH